MQGEDITRFIFVVNTTNEIVWYTGSLPMRSTIHLVLIEVHLELHNNLKGCQGEGDSYSCQATGFTCDGLDEFCAEKERQCDEMTWKCLGGKLECHSEDQDICDQLEIDCSKEKDSSLNKAKMKPSSFIQEAVETSARTAIHRHRKKQMSSTRSWLSEAHL